MKSFKRNIQKYFYFNLFNHFSVFIMHNVYHDKNQNINLLGVSKSSDNEEVDRYPKKGTKCPFIDPLPTRRSGRKRRVQYSLRGYNSPSRFHSDRTDPRRVTWFSWLVAGFFEAIYTKWGYAHRNFCVRYMGAVVHCPALDRKRFQSLGTLRIWGQIGKSHIIIIWSISQNLRLDW